MPQPEADWADVVSRIERGDPAGEEILYRSLATGARFFLQRRLGLQDVSVHENTIAFGYPMALNPDTGKFEYPNPPFISAAEESLEVEARQPSVAPDVAVVGVVAVTVMA